MPNAENPQPPAIDYTTQPAPRSGTSLTGATSCLIALLGCLQFFHAWNQIGRIPVNRQTETLSLYTSFLSFWTSAFWLAALFGCALAAIGIIQKRKGRLLAYLGLLLNIAGMVALYTLQSTGGHQIH